jgi:hypothetical protein
MNSNVCAHGQFGIDHRNLSNKYLAFGAAVVPHRENIQCRPRAKKGGLKSLQL